MKKPNPGTDKVEVSAIS